MLPFFDFVEIKLTLTKDIFKNGQTLEMDKTYFSSLRWYGRPECAEAALGPQAVTTDAILSPQVVMILHLQAFGSPCPNSH